METRFGHDFSQVRIHDGIAAGESARTLGANAYTLGPHIVFGVGQYRPHETAGQVTLAHELAHVVQQRHDPSTGGAVGLGMSDPQDPQESAAEQIARVVTMPGQRVTPVIPAAARTDPGPGHLIQRQKAAGSAEKTPPATDVEDVYGPPNRGAGVVTIEQFIRDVETVEAANPGRSGPEILTLIRKLYYGDRRFDRLIPDAPEVPAVESCFDDEGRPCGGPVGVCVCHYVSGEHEPSDKLQRAIRRLRQHADESASGDNPSPYVLVGDDLIDIGHVVLGIDARLHPESAEPFQRYDLTAVTGGAGWEADIGIAMVTLQEHEDNGHKSPDVVGDLAPTLEDYYRNSAPMTDLLGDVDPFGVSPPTRYQSLSSVLRAYYLGDSETGPLYQSRWQIFAETNALAYTVDKTGKVSWKAGTKELVVARISRFADLYALRDSPFTALFRGVQHRKWNTAGRFADRFLQDVAAGIEKEQARIRRRP